MYLSYGKRMFDIIGSLIILVVFSWLFLVIFVIYLISYSFPVFFKQERIGKDEASFMIYKFRTLKAARLPIESRKFPLGSFLRFTSLDELPQLLNVLRGEMSLIGPRPLPVGYLPHFSVDQRKRHRIRPGISGWAQLNGRHAISWQRKFEYDLYYVDNVSFLLDIRIAFRTLLLLLSFKKDNSLKEKEFVGNA